MLTPAKLAMVRQGVAVSSLMTRCMWYSSSPAAHKHFCVVGTGPAGFYTADRLLKRFGESARVDLVDALPSPFGLVRSGVAPDHPDTKNVIHQFSALATTDPRVRFFGHLRLGRDIQLGELRRRYDAVVLSYGAESDRSLGIPGEATPGVLSAREFVWWYNGHPSAAGLSLDLRNVRSVAIVGLGNVALDCARVLLQGPDRLAGTDIAEHALQALRESGVRDVHIVGRRGPVQSTFTPKELRELLNMSGIGVDISAGPLQNLSPACEAELAGSRIKRRVLEILTKSASAGKQGSRALHLHFLSSPAEFVSEDGGSKLTGLRLDQQRLEGSGAAGSVAKPLPTGQSTTLPVDLVLKSIGYKSLPVPGLPFDVGRGVVPNRMGQVVESTAPDAPAVPGLFVAGWLGRGPTGIIGTNLIDAEQTVESMVRASESWDAPVQGPGLEGGVPPETQVVDWAGWGRIDAAEVAAGAAVGKPREKMTSIPAMLSCAADVP